MLQYNLALTYAQLGQYGTAFQHFKRSFSLNRNNKVSAILAILTQRLANLEDEEILENLRDDINEEGIQNAQKNHFYENLLDYLNANLDDTYLYTNYAHDNSVLNIFYKMILASKIGNYSEEKRWSNELKTLLGDNIVSNILYFYTQNKNLDKKKFAKNAILFMKTNSVFLDILYYGPIMAKEMYINLANISGLTYSIRDILKERVITEKHDVRGVLQALAFVDIYLNFFEESFSIYNQLIDTFDETDPMTLFLAAVSAIGAQKPANAIALLELANLSKDMVNMEARFALALLYQQSNNLQATNIHLKAIDSDTFFSEYFDFNIKKDDL